MPKWPEAEESLGLSSPKTSQETSPKQAGQPGGATPLSGSLPQGPLVRLAGWQADSAVDGPGLRFVVFAQGCPHRCPGCHNPETHLPIGGKVLSVDQIFDLYQQSPGQEGITLSGGEPFAQAGPLALLAAKVKAAGGDVVCYTGYLHERLKILAQTQADVAQLLQTIDLLIDGPFILAQRTLTLPFRGSSNQRIIPLTPTGDKLAAEIGRCRDRL